MKLTLILFLSLCLFSCKKDKDDPSELLLTEITSNGATHSRFQYDSENRLSRYEIFSANVLGGYITLSYNSNGHISQVAIYTMPGDVPSTRIEAETDAKGQIVKLFNYDLQGPDPNSPSGTSEFTFNGNGQLTHIERHDGDDDFISRDHFLYFPDGNLKEAQSFRNNDDEQLFMFRRTNYSISNGYKPVGFDRLLQILGPAYVADIYSETQQTAEWNQDGGIVTNQSIIKSGRELNGDGSIKKQVITTNFVAPVKPDVVSNRSYTYISK